MYDIALDFKRGGDWVFSANADFQGVKGIEVVVQRMLTRLKIVRGWELDPTNGTLGSRLRADLRLPHGRAVRELPLTIREALAPMEDLEINNILVTDNEDDSRGLNVRIDYSVLDLTTPVPTERLANSLLIQLGP